jgi:hypothetical protein
MLEVLTPYLTVLSYKQATIIAWLGLIPSFFVMLRSRFKPHSSPLTAFACGAGMVGAWGVGNGAMIFFGA